VADERFIGFGNDPVRNITVTIRRMIGLDFED
jgi:hypothetical protein